MQETTLSGWNGLAALVDAHKRQTDWIYRGVTRSCFQLAPKIGRKGERKDSRVGCQGALLPYSEMEERCLLEEFERKAQPLLTLQPKTKLEWMAVAQHHELKTRLLDWTESLLVAAMFATEKGRLAGSPPAIYGVRGLSEADDGEKKDPFNLTEVKVYRPAHISDRIAPQQAVFTVHPKPDQDFRNHPGLHCWLLDINGTLDMKLALDAVGINRAALFPGVDGLARALNWRHKWGTLRG